MWWLTLRVLLCGQSRGSTRVTRNNYSQQCASGDSDQCGRGVQLRRLTRVSGARPGWGQTGGRVCSLRVDWVERWPWPAHVGDVWSLQRDYLINPKGFQNIPNISMRDGAARSHRATRRNKTRLGAAWTRWTRPTATADTPRAPCGASACCGVGGAGRVQWRGHVVSGLKFVGPSRGLMCARAPGAAAGTW